MTKAYQVQLVNVVVHAFVCVHVCVCVCACAFACVCVCMHDIVYVYVCTDWCHSVARTTTRGELSCLCGRTSWPDGERPPWCSWSSLQHKVRVTYTVLKVQYIYMYVCETSTV